jgi:hypothetical protein
VVIAGILIGLLLMIIRRSTQASGQAMSFGKSRARFQMEAKTGVGFGNVAGIDEAKEAHDYVTALDCQAWRMNSIFNQILRKAAQENDIILYDFDMYMKDQWGKNTLFIDDIYPQDLYYQNMAKTISQMLKKLLNL